MGESVITEMTEEFNDRLVSRDDRQNQIDKNAHAMASLWVCVWMALLFPFLFFSNVFYREGHLRMWLWADFRINFPYNDILFYAIWGIVALIITKVFYLVPYAWVQYEQGTQAVKAKRQPRKRTTKTTRGDTSILDYMKTKPTAVLNNGESLIELEERAENVGGMEFTSDMMAIIRRLAIQSNKMTRDHVWQPLKDEGLIDGSVVLHYQKSMKLFTHSSRKWVSGYKWTPNAYRSFLRVDSPLLAPEVMQNPDFVSDDDDDGRANFAP